MKLTLNKKQKLVINADDTRVKDDGLRFFIGGESGSGKSNASMLIASQWVEQGGQAIVLDAHGEYGTLWEARPGGEKSVVRFGYGEPPVREESVELCMSYIREGHSLVLDLSHWTDLHPDKLDGFVRELMRDVYELRRSKPRQTLIVIEEAQAFCLTPDTEVLTSSGWAKHTELRKGMPIACFDLARGTWDFEGVQQVHRRQYAGPMWGAKTARLDMLMTPDHRVVTRVLRRAGPDYGKKTPWGFERANDTRSNLEIPSAPARAKSSSGLPESLDFFRALGWFMTDGSMHSDRTKSLTISQGLITVKNGERLHLLMAEKLNSFGAKTVHYRARGPHRGMDIYMGVEASKQFLKYLDPKNIHRIPRKVLSEASDEQLRAVLQGLCEGDGSHRHGRWSVIHTCAKLGLEVDIQELCLRLGISSTVVPAASKGFIVRLRNEKNVPHSVRRGVELRQQKYKGLVWDVTVPTGAFLARRNGTVFVTGNCPQQQMTGQAANIRMFTALITGGRKFGLNFVLSTQRQSLVDSNVIAGCNVRLFMRISEVKDWKKLKPYLPVKMPVSFGGVEKKDITKFQSGETLLLSRWFAPQRIRLDLPSVPVKRFL